LAIKYKHSIQREGPLILKEVEGAINKMKFGKSVGKEGIALEMLKAFGNFVM